MDLVTGWTGRAACALQAALRMSNETFAAHLGIAVRTVAAWELQAASLELEGQATPAAPAGEGEPSAPAVATTKVPLDISKLLSDDEISPFYDAVIESTEEAILNALLAAETMTGKDGNTVHALEPELLVEVLRQL